MLSNSLSFFSSAGTSKIPPEFGQPAFQSPSIQRQEVSDIVFTHAWAIHSLCCLRFKLQMRKSNGARIWLNLLFRSAVNGLMIALGMEKSEGIIIRLTKLTETSLIVHWCTRDQGLIKTVAKGGRRSKGPLAGKLDLFFEAELNWVRSRKSELHTLSEVAVLDYRENLRKRYKDTLVASYFVDLLAHVAEPDHPVPDLYDLLARGLGYLVEQGADQRGVLHFEHELARLSGVAHDRSSAFIALEQAFGSLPKSRSSCMDAIGH